jgi:L-rhamnose mutarotase
VTVTIEDFTSYEIFKRGKNVYLIIFEDKTNFLFVYIQMEVKKGKYTFFITNNIETWNGVITGITPTGKKNETN